jgi:hypothetical protein
MASKQFFVRLGDGNAYCPISETTLRRLANRGWLRANDRIAISKNGPWHKVSPACGGGVIDVARIGNAESLTMNRRHAVRGCDGNNWNQRRK